MSFEVRNAKRAAIIAAPVSEPQRHNDTFEARNVSERGPVLADPLWGKYCDSLAVRVLRAFCEVNNLQLDYADEYGEPGYTDPEADCCILAADWNHIPKSLYERLEAQGHKLEWSDEWYFDCDKSPVKAWRTSPDSMSFVPRVRARDGYMITPDSDPQEWIDSAKDDHDPLPYWFDIDELTSRGWEQIEEHSRHYADHAQASVNEQTKAGRDALLVFDDGYTVWVRREYTELDDVLTVLGDERKVTRDQCTEAVLNAKIWVAGAGAPGCLYDLGPEYHATKESAVKSMVDAIGYELETDEESTLEQDKARQHEACESLGLTGSAHCHSWRYEVSESTLRSIL